MFNFQLTGKYGKTGAAFLAAPVLLFFIDESLKESLAAKNFFALKHFLLIVIVYPFIEEIIFRGFLQSELLQKQEFRKKIANISFANLTVSCVFALCHIAVFKHSLIALVFFPSLVFGWIFENNRKLWLCILCHGWYNFSLHIF